MAAKKGRPSAYTKALAERILLKLAEGESLNEICKSEKFPSKSSVYRWLLNPKLRDFRDNYAQARAIQAEQMADELLDIADDCSNDWMERNGIEVVNNEAVNRSRLRIDTRKFLLSKLLPKKYGDRVDLAEEIEPKDRERRRYVLVPMSERE